MLKRLPKKSLALSIAAVVMLAVAACGGSSGSPAPAANGTPAHTPFTMGIIHVGSKTDAGYNQAHAEAAAVVEKNLPYVKILEAENISESADVSRVIENMIAQGAKFIVPGSFGYL